MIVGDLTTVRQYLDLTPVYALDSIVVTEQGPSDGPGRVVPASEWDVIDEDTD